MNSDKEIRELFARHNVELARNDVWAVQGKPVIHHKALERLAAEIGIRWKAPQILRAERDEAVILVTGELEKDQTVVSEWSIGEAAVNVNYRVSGKQAAYVYAMAEKRGKDRVIIKLAGLHGAYSNEEADNFDQQPDAPATAPEPAPAPRKPVPEYAYTFIDAMRMAANLDDLTEWARVMKPEIEKLPDEARAAIRDAYAAHRTQLAEADYQKEAAE
jgi:hypothetical protein